MRLLFDQNLSRKLVGDLSAEYPGSTHVAIVRMETADDRLVWGYAADHDSILVSKDSDFAQLAFLHGAPPKVIWLRIGNAATTTIARRLREVRVAVEAFVADPDEALLEVSAG